LNEILKEIKDKAWDYAVNSDDRYSHPTTQLFDEKFSELIIKECIKEISKYNVISFAIDGLKEHFGIE